MNSNGKHKTALVTGGTGFVGSHLVRRLVNDGWEVHVVVRTSAACQPQQMAWPGVLVYGHDGSTESMLQIVRSASPGVVFHLASLFISEHCSADVEPMIQSNVLFGTQLLEAMRFAGVERLVNAGTSWQHYHSQAYCPANLYAATKQAFEDILKYYVESSGLRAITLKLFDTYGPGDTRPKLMNLLRRLAATGETLPMSPGGQLVDLVYIDDVVDAFLVAAGRFAKSIKGYETFALSSRRPVSLKDLVMTVGRISGKTLSIQWGGRPYRLREVMVPWGGGRCLPGWRQKVSLEDGVRKTMEFADEKT